MPNPWLNKVKSLFKGDDTSSSTAALTDTGPSIIPRAGHVVSRKYISDNALKVLYRLRSSGYEAFIVGGCVRDVLIGISPKDFDIATNAEPEEINALFRNSMIIGRRFRLVHIRFGREVFEVATFRGNEECATGAKRASDDSGRLVRDNIFGSLEEDAWRRDFTVNALYYNIDDFSIHDYVGGLRDVEDRVIRIIGEAETRYREDPVRMLRAIRFAAKLDFAIHPDTAEPIHELGYLLGDIPAARLFEEVLKLFHGGAAKRTYELLCEYGLLKYLFPLTDEALDEAEPHAEALILRALSNTDRRINEGKPVTPAFLYAVMMWEWIQQQASVLQQQGPMSPFQQAVNAAIEHQIQCTSLPKRFRTPLRDIWYLQARLERTRSKRCLALLDNQRFRAAYDFLLLRSETGSASPELAQWWTDIQLVAPEKREHWFDKHQADNPGKPNEKKPSRNRNNRNRNRNRQRNKPNSDNAEQ